MADPQPIPKWLKSLPLAPEYHPTETEFADPIAFISRIEQEAAAFGICKIVPPLSKPPSRKFVLSNLTRSLAPTSSPAPPPLFTTRHQELGSRKPPHRHRQQVWQSGQFYTLDQFESKSRTFQKSQLSSFKEVTPLLIESLFWKATSEKPIYIEYANDVPGSGFAVPDPNSTWKKRRKVVGWELSNSPWNLQVIARAPGSLTRFMPDEVPGVTSPMVYIGMLFSWFAWHVEDHELHSLNFLHTGAAKTWYAVPGEYASTVEEIVRVEGYGGDIDRLDSFTMLGEKTTLLSPEVILNAGVPCCRLVQNPGEFVVTFPRAYHVGFSHGFNCGEAANFATPQWLKMAKEAAVRRAAMNYLPMLSHQQLLYMLTVSYASRIPRALLLGVRSSRLKDRKREEREILVKKAFLYDLMNENNLVCTLLSKESSTKHAVLWEPDLLSSQCTTVPPSFSSSLSLEAQIATVSDDQGEELSLCKHYDSHLLNDRADNYSVENLPTANIPNLELLEILDSDEDDLPLGLNIDSGTLACVSCGILGYPLMAIVQPSETATRELFSMTCGESHQKIGKLGCSCTPSCLPDAAHRVQLNESRNMSREQENPDSSCKLSLVQSDQVSKDTCARDGIYLLNDDNKGLPQHLIESNLKISNVNSCFVDYSKASYSDKVPPFGGLKGQGGSMTMKTQASNVGLSNAIVDCARFFSEKDNLLADPVETNKDTKWTSCKRFNRPRIFCLQHALEIERLLHDKGGAHVLIICHSDYLKVKAYAPSVAEEVGMRFKIKDVPLENASPSDLNLINISIDDGEVEEHGEDWTSKLGVNLRYCVKLRKQSTSKQDRLTLALGRLFSDPFSLSDASTLKWHSRRSRTPYKVVGISVAKPHVDMNMERRNDIGRNLNMNFAKKVGCFSWRRGPNYTTSINEKIPNKDDSIKGLFTVPIAAAEDLQNHQTSCIPLKVSTSYEITDPESYDSCHPCIHIPVLDSSDVHQETNSIVEFLANCKVDTSKDPESRSNYTQPEAVNSELEQESEAFNKIDSELVVHNSSDLQDPKSKGSVGIPLLSSDQNLITELPGDNAEMRQEVSISDVHKIEESAFHSSRPEEQLIDGLSTVDSSTMQEKDISWSEVSVEEMPKMDVCFNHSSCSLNQIVSSLSAPERCRVQQEEIQSVSIAEKPKMGGVHPCSSSKKELVNDLSIIDSSQVQQEETLQLEMSSLEALKKDGSVDHSSQSEGSLVSNLSTRQTCGMQQEDFTGTNNKIDFLKPVVDSSSVNSTHVNTVFVSISSETRETDTNKMDIVETFHKNLNTACTIQYVRRRMKRMREEHMVEGHYKSSDSPAHPERDAKHFPEDHHSCNGSFIRSPCEGLRPRSGRAMSTLQKADVRTTDENSTESNVKRMVRKGKHKEFRKRFKKPNKHSVRHQPDDDRPFKCPWKGCGMSFKWGWAKTEHFRIHTGERPYKCMVAGCELTFRYISDYSRHRRKTGHYVKSTNH